jgi:response regulator of citrate/malate metabolism
MTLTALLVCVDEAAAQVLRRVLEELSIQVESCPDFARASVRLAQDRFDLVIVDGESNAEVVTLLRDSRMSRMNDATLAIAVVSGQESIREMFSLGVNFVLYKPVAYERAASSLRAARAVMRKEKRKSARAPVHAHATVDYANVQQEKATLVDLAQDGMSVRFGKKLPPTGKVYFQFQLPDQSSSVRLSGQIVWQDWNGRAGIQFADVPKTSRRLLTEFLSANIKGELQSDRFPDLSAENVTVNVEEPLQMVGVSVGEPTHGSEARESERLLSHEKLSHEKPSPEEAHSVQSEPVAASTDPDKRAQARHSCRLGAEVYRTGTSVPNHCCLTDLSSGGCYLEVSLPLPAGSSVEIVVRTYDMKLRLRGTVLASHPGYGMGVSFELKTKEERESVKKLTDFVVATGNNSN